MKATERVPLDSSTAIGRFAIAMMNQARAQGTGVRELVGRPVRIATCRAGGHVYLNRTTCAPRVTWACRNWSVAEALDYLRDPAAPEPAGWRASVAARLQRWE